MNRYSCKFLFFTPQKLLRISPSQSSNVQLSALILKTYVFQSIKFISAEDQERLLANGATEFLSPTQGIKR